MSDWRLEGGLVGGFRKRREVVAILQGGLEGLADSEFFRGGFVVGVGTLLGVDFGFCERGPGSSCVSD
jgi:hypothetical protein